MSETVGKIKKTMAAQMMSDKMLVYVRNFNLYLASDDAVSFQQCVDNM